MVYCCAKDENLSHKGELVNLSGILFDVQKIQGHLGSYGALSDLPRKLDFQNLTLS